MPPPKNEAPAVASCAGGGDASEGTEPLDQVEIAAKAAADKPPSPLERIWRVASLVACRRRPTQAAETRAVLTRYREMVMLGRRVSERRKTWYEKLMWWSEAKTKKGNDVFVVAPRGPKGQTDVWIYMWEFLAFAVSKLHDHVVSANKPFCIIWCQHNDHRMWPCSLWNFMQSLHPRYKENLEAVHIVHPSWACRFLRLFLWPLASDSFWDYFTAHERIEFMYPHIDMKEFMLPKDIVEYDKFLDTQAVEMAQKQSNNFGGGSMLGGGGMGGMDMSKVMKEQHEAQMEQMKKMMQEQGMMNDHVD